MTKNTGSQVIGAQMVSASDGSAFTGTVTVAVTGDGGSQATGSVGSGVCTHEGNGYHTYTPSQGETNYNLIAFTFTGTGAIPVTVQVFTTAWAKSLANVPANVTQFGGSNGTFASGRPEVNASHIAGSSVSTSAAQIGVNVVNAGGTAWATVVTNLVTAIWSATTRLLTAGTNIVLAKGTGVTGFNDLDAAGVRSAVGLASADLDTQLAAIVEDTGTTLPATLTTIDGVVDGIKAVTDALPDAGALTSLAQASDLATVDSNVDAILADTAALDGRVPSDPADQSLIIDATNAIMSRLGSPAGASMSADLAAVKSDTAAILTDTGATLDGKLDAIDSVVDGIKAVTDLLPDAGALSSLATAAALTTVDSVVDGIAVQTSRVDALIEDSSGDRFTAKALEQAPSGGGSIPTAEEIADAVWDEDLSGHTTEDSAGEILGNVATGTPPSAEAIADEVQTRTIAAVTTVGSVTNGVTLADNAITAAKVASDAVTEIQSGLATASALATVDSNVDAILADTDAIDARLPSDPADQSLIVAATDAIVADTEDIQAKIGTPADTLAADIATRLAAASYTAPPSAATNAGAVRTELATELARIDAAVSTRATPADVPSAADTAAAVQSSATASPLPADVKKINNATLTGDGNGTPWGPA